VSNSFGEKAFVVLAYEGREEKSRQPGVSASLPPSLLVEKYRLSFLWFDPQSCPSQSVKAVRIGISHLVRDHAPSGPYGED